jgi:hypothetical protein
VLLTRSRLCPRPKPGSSLHLHVLGTPPAFVLSQDQTLREELGQPPYDGSPKRSDLAVIRHSQKSRQGYNPLTAGRPRSPNRGRVKSWADPLEGSGPRATYQEPEYTGGLPGARRGQSWHRRPNGPRTDPSSDGVEPGHTPRPKFGRRVRMLLSFQRPSHLFRKGFLLSGTPGIRKAIPGRTDEYSAQLLARDGGEKRF